MNLRWAGGAVTVLIDQSAGTPAYLSVKSGREYRIGRTEELNVCETRRGSPLGPFEAWSNSRMFRKSSLGSVCFRRIERLEFENSLRSIGGICLHSFVFVTLAVMLSGKTTALPTKHPALSLQRDKRVGVNGFDSFRIHSFVVVVQCP